MAEEGKRTVAVIVPAYNEASRISAVLRAVRSCRLVDEVIVVDDGSEDDTADVAEQVPGVQVVRLAQNKGKGGAMAEGVRATRAPLVAFVDADLGGLEGGHLERIIQPLLENKCEMSVGIFRGGKMWSDAAQRVSPYLSGQRAMKREVFEAVPNIDDLGYQVEIALNAAAKRRKDRVLRVVLRGVSNCFKEEKSGLVKGTVDRLKMYSEIGQAMAKTMVKPKKRPRRRLKKRNDKWHWPP
ncbi:MAG TPA: glycosyltransferase family 2 protein [Fimbriimonas sp.]|nr:glycosyltransferase family 2 protein [Fimbriimonas sp.]